MVVECEQIHPVLAVKDLPAAVEFHQEMRHIEELKKRHGIDYDCHASYRFVEE